MNENFWRVFLWATQLQPKLDLNCQFWQVWTWEGSSAYLIKSFERSFFSDLESLGLPQDHFFEKKTFEKAQYKVKKFNHLLQVLLKEININLVLSDLVFKYKIFFDPSRNFFLSFSRPSYWNFCSWDGRFPSRFSFH